MNSYKIIEGVYVFPGIISMDDKDKFFEEKNDFERIEYLTKQKPLASRIIKKSNGTMFYSPRIGNFVVSSAEKKLLRFEEEHSAKGSANYFYSVISNFYVQSLGSFQEMKNFLNQNPSNLPRF